MSNLLKKSFDQSKDVITIILCSIALLCGCQEKVKHIYRVPTSAHLAQLEQQEKALKDSLDKYCAVLDTAQINYYLPLWQAARDTCGVVLHEETDAFIAAVEEALDSERDASKTTTLSIVLYVLLVLAIAAIIFALNAGMVWTRIGWFFQDQWKRLKRNFNDSCHNSLLVCPCCGPENLTDEDIHEIMNIIHQGNPPKYKIVREEKKNGRIIRTTCEVEKDDAEGDTSR